MYYDYSLTGGLLIQMALSFHGMHGVGQRITWESSSLKFG